MMESIRKLGARRRLTRLIQDGVGVREHSWVLSEASLAPEREELTERVLSWIRQVMGEMKRPNGVDHIALAMACRDGQGRVVCTNSFGVVRPGDFYGERAAERLTAFFDDVQGAGVQGEAEIVGAILCLGDIAYELNRPPLAA